MTTLSVQGQSIFKLDVEGVLGAGGLGLHELRFPARLTRLEWPGGAEPVLIDITADVAVTASARGGRIGIARLIHPPIVGKGRGGIGQCTLGLEVDTAKLESIERIRGGGDLSFRLDFRATFLSHGIEGSFENAIVTVNQSAWARALDEMGYMQFVLIELPVPRTSSDEKAVRAAAALRTARELMQDGRYRPAMAQCRNALEILEGDMVKVPSETFGLLRGGLKKESLTKAQRLSAIHAAMKLVSNLAHHEDEVARDVTFDRQEVAAFIMMTSGALALLTERDE